MKWLLIIPNQIVLIIVLFAVAVTTFLAWFAILFTGHYPRGLFDFAESTTRWMMNVAAYGWFLRDEYPPFSGAPGLYPVEFSITYPPRMNQILILFKWLTVIPSALVFDFILLAGSVVSLAAFFAILFTGRMPRGMHSFLAGMLRWDARIIAYQYYMTDVYPPFRLSP